METRGCGRWVAEVGTLEEELGGRERTPINKTRDTRSRVEQKRGFPFFFLEKASWSATRVLVLLRLLSSGELLVEPESDRPYLVLTTMKSS